MVSEELEKAWEDIASLKKEVRSLKTRLGKLTGRIDQLDLIGFQDQLNRLDERITGFSNELTQIRQQVFKHFFSLLREVANQNLHGAGHPPPFPPTWLQASQTCSLALQGYYLEARERIKHCQDEKEMQDTLDSFWDKTNDALGNYGFPQIQRAK